MEGVPKVGQVLTYTDEHGRKRAALVTNVGFDDPKTWINVVIVNLDENQKDDYGRKLERKTSVSSGGPGWTGNFWTL